MARKQTLLEKYEIPINNLDFDYINNCEKSKEIEMILEILNSGEEGFYLDLIKYTEKKLRELNPNSKMLWTEGLYVQNNNNSKCNEVLDLMNVRKDIIY